MTLVSESNAVKALYTKQQISRMQGNPLIEALPPALPDEEVFQALSVLPDFSVDQRAWDNHLRVQQVLSLTSFMLPLSSHLTLARSLDATMREGYVSRAPFSRELNLQLQNAYELQKKGQTFAQTRSSSSSTYTGALLGVPGMGKSTTVARWLSQYPRVIVHRDEHGREFHQVTYIHIEMTSDASSVKALAIAIISAIDALLPTMGYHHLYLESPGRASTEALIHTSARLIAIHHVGLVVVDELQNLATSKKGMQRVMTEVVSLCNTLKVPLVFLGTNKAQEVLGADFRSGRRAIGGLGYWGPLPRYDSGALVPEAADEPSEWADFVTALWAYMWVREPGPLTPDILDLLYLRTQGVIDLVIKLVVIAQVRAIHTGTETVDAQMLETVFQEEFRVLHPVLDAMAQGHADAMEKFADVKSVDVVQRAQVWTAKARGKASSREAQVASRFTDQVAKTLIESGMAKEDAIALAAQQAEEAPSGQSKTVLETVEKISKNIRPTSLKKSTTRKSTGAAIVYPDFSSRPGDYRRAFVQAQQRKEMVLDTLRTMGMLRSAEELVPID